MLILFIWRSLTSLVRSALQQFKYYLHYDNGTANSRVAHDVLFEEWERQLGVCMGVLGKSRQGCVGVINNIGALTNLLTSLVLPNPSAYMYIVYSLM